MAISEIDTLEFDTDHGYTPKVLNVSGDVCVIAYRDDRLKVNDNR